MKAVIQQLWQVIRTREKSLVATKILFEDWLKTEQGRRKSAETIAKDFKKRFKAELKAHEHWQELFRQAESQLEQERLLRDQEVAAKERCKRHLIKELEASAHWKKLFFDVERQRDHEHEIRKQEESAKLHAELLAKEEAEARQHWEELFHQAETQREQEREGREQEATAKEHAQKVFAAEAEARQHWEDLFHKAEAQREQEREGREQEAAAKEHAQKVFKAEADARQHWEQLFHKAETQRDQERKGREQEAAAKDLAQKDFMAEAEARAHWEQLFHKAETQRDQERKGREQEAIAKELAQKVFKAEADARQHWEQLFHKAETQRDQERKGREQEAIAKEHAQKVFKAEADARQHWEQLFHKAETQRDQERKGREQEAIAKEHAQKVFKAEAAARERWEQLFHKAETQRDQERQGREKEATAKELAQKDFKAEAEAREHWQELFHKAETQREQERAGREQEADAKGHALVWANAAESAKEHWKRSYFECEAQRDVLAAKLAEIRRKPGEPPPSLEALLGELSQSSDVVDTPETADSTNPDARQEELAAQITALTVRLAQSNFTRELAEEHDRVERRRRTFFGRWLAFRDGSARLIRTVYCFMRMKPRAPAPSSPGPRVAQVNTHDIVGGAERTSYDLHLAFRERGLKPILIVGGKYGQDADVFKMPFKDIDWKPARIWRDRWGLTEVVAPTPFLGAFKWPELRESHVVHIHNMHGNYWNIATLLPLGMQHPVVLTLHDEYAMTGDCCYTYDCNRWMRSCGKCPRINLPREARYAIGGGDLTRLNVHLKRALLHAPRAYPLVAVAPSRWLADRARRSPNLRHLPVALIHYGIDLQFWRALPQAEARRALGLPEGKTIGLIVANYVSDPRKGFDVALDAIRKLPLGHNLVFVVAGNISEEIKTELAGLPVIAAGFVGDKVKMLNLFSAADFTFSMSRMDNLPYMCIESLACGRPVFGAAVGGIPEIVNEESLGWLAAKPFDAQAIAGTLAQIDAESAEVRASRFAACRRSAEARFDLKVMTERYLALYREMQLAARERRPVDIRHIAPAVSPP